MPAARSSTRPARARRPPLDPAGPAEPGADVTQRLLAAAAEVFSERGYDGASVHTIARRAGLTTGAIYSRFSGKAELLLASLDAHADGELDQLFADERFAGHSEQILNVAGAHLVSRGDRTMGGLLLEAFAAARRDPETAEMLRRRLADRSALLTQVIERSKAEGHIAADFDSDALVHFAHAIALGFLLYRAAEIEMPAVAPWEQLIASVVGGLANPPLDTTSTTTATKDPS